MNLPRTLGELRTSNFSEQRLISRKVKDEIRENLTAKIRTRETIFPGIVGYDDTVVPQLINAVLLGVFEGYAWTAADCDAPLACFAKCR